MSFDSSGTFTRIAGAGSTGATVWQDDAAAGTRILSSRHDTHDQDLANGLSVCLTRKGWGVPEVDIPWGGKKIVNLNNPSAPQDAATKDYVDTLTGWPKSKDITGADLDGRLNFTASSGVNGITWSYADLAWVARGSTPGEANQRLVLTPTAVPDTTGPAAGLTDVFIIDDVGHINTNAGILTDNTSYEGATTRTISPGTGTILDFNGGAFGVSSNDVATITNNYASFTARTFFKAQNATGTITVTLDKSASGKFNRIAGTMAAKNRWTVDLGDATAETTERVGSDFVLKSYNNDGTTPTSELTINRATHKATFAGEVVTSNLTTTDALMTVGPSTAGSTFSLARPISTGSTVIFGGASNGGFLQLYGNAHATSANNIVLGAAGTVRYSFDYSSNTHGWNNNSGTAVMTLNGIGDTMIAGALTFDSGLTSSDATVIMATTGAGTIYLRPNGAASTTDQVTITGGDLYVQPGLSAATGGVYAGKGLRGKIGESGAYGGFYQNFNWTGAVLNAYTGTTLLGAISYTCDYRIKKNVSPLPSMWDRVKALNPISYSQKAYDIWVNDDTVRWGFLAHELQDQLDPQAASGTKDGPDVQSPNLLAIIAALTKALQEAMARIESLESA